MGDPEKSCVCTSTAIDRYRARLSGPILDRIDLFLQVPRIKARELEHPEGATTTAELRTTVIRVHGVQRARYADTPISRNAEMSNEHIEKYGHYTDEAKAMAIRSTERLHLSTRVYYRILRVARTIADIEGSSTVEVPHILEAFSYR